MSTQNNVIVIENVRSSLNVGAIIRAADCLGFDVILSGYTPHPAHNTKVKKSSLGAENCVAITQFEQPGQTMEFLKKSHYTVISAETGDKSQELTTVKQYRTPVAIIVGNEKEGILDSTQKESDIIAKIEMRGHKESFNVSQAAAIFMRYFQSK